MRSSYPKITSPTWRPESATTYGLICWKYPKQGMVIEYCKQGGLRGSFWLTSYGLVHLFLDSTNSARNSHHDLRVTIHLNCLKYGSSSAFVIEVLSHSCENSTIRILTEGHIVHQLTQGPKCTVVRRGHRTMLDCWQSVDDQLTSDYHMNRLIITLPWSFPLGWLARSKR